MAKGDIVGLELPPQAGPDEDVFDIRSRKLTAWVEALPTGNIGETTRQLYQALHDVNRHSHSWKQRYHFLETIRPTLHLVQQAISRRFAGQSLPLPPKTRQIAALSQTLYTELAIGYKAALVDMLASSFLFQDRSALKTMVHRCVRYLSQSILTSYQIYTQQHSGAWQELHRLYAFAEERGIQQDQIVDPFISELPESSIARLYKQIVLLASASPFRLRHGEAIAIYKALARWSAHARLIEPGDKEADNALFVIHRASDDEPDYHAFDPRPCEKGTCLLVDTRQLVHVLREEAAYTTLPPGSVMSPELIARLIQNWAVAPKRGESRLGGGQSMVVVVGMTRIHNLLAPSLYDRTMESNLSLFESRSLRSEERLSSANDIWNIYATKKPQVSHPSMSSKGTTAQEPPPSSEIQRWEVRNESPGGYRLAIPEKQTAGIRVGELLAMRNEQSSTHWQPAVVRWIRQFPHTGIEAGVQVLAPQMIAVMVKNLTPGKDKGEHQRGLLLPAMAELNLHATLLLPNRIFLSKEAILLHTPHSENEIVLGNQLQDSGIFVQFEFNSPQATEQKLSVEQNPATDESHFDQLWEQL